MTAAGRLLPFGRARRRHSPALDRAAYLLYRLWRWLCVLAYAEWRECKMCGGLYEPYAAPRYRKLCRGCARYVDEPKRNRE